MRAYPVALLLVLVACQAGPGRGKAPAESSPPTVMQFVADDYAGALAEAKARGVPLFIEAWAPW